MSDAARAVRRRAFLTGLAGATAALAAACGGAPVSPTAAPKPAEPTKPAASAAPTAAPTTAAKPAALSGAGQGTLTVAVGIHFPGTLDATKDGFTLIFLGVAETLTRLTPAQTLEPWLAESVTNLDPTTWQVKLRRGPRFWDGSPVIAEAVADAFKRNWETQPAADRFISKQTHLTVVDETTLRFKTPRPLGDFPHSLATQFFAIHKPGSDGASIMTGPYRPAKFVKDQELVLAGVDHWAGPAPLKQLTIKLVTDANARILSLQSGDADMLFGLPPESVKGLPADIERVVKPSTRLHQILLNHQRPPFNDRAVREATASAIDRAALNTVALDGLGAVATGFFPPNAGLDVVDAQRSDPVHARRLLDEAGWQPGADGVRVKNGQRLAFTLYSYPGRAELTPMAIAIQAQLKTLGYDVKVQEVRDITAQIKDGNFEASMYSLNAAVTGDPQYKFVVELAKGAAYNYGGYANPAVDALIDQLASEPERTKRQAISRQIQEIVKADVPNIYLVAAPLVYAYKKGKVSSFTFHPNDLYFIDRSLTVAR